MSADKDGGPAFPNSSKPMNGEVAEWGMSLRDWFAGQALGHIPELLAANERNKSVQNVADWAYCVADAMLAAREKGTK